MTAPSASSREPQPLRVPPAQVHFPASDREEILRRIQAAHSSLPPVQRRILDAFLTRPQEAVFFNTTAVARA